LEVCEKFLEGEKGSSKIDFEKMEIDL